MFRGRALPLAALVAVGLVARAAHAEKERFEVGEAVQVFALKAVNPDVAGAPIVSIDSFYGPDAKAPKKAILLSFFATYCEPCKREMPYLAALQDLYKDKGLQVLSVSIDREQEQIDFVKNLATDSGAKFPVLSDRFNIVAKRYFVSKLPNVYLINSEGKVALVKVGYNDDISRVLLDEVRKLIGEPVTAPVPESLAKHMSHGAPAKPETPAPADVATPADATTPAAGSAAAETPADEPTKGKGKAKGAAKGKGKAKSKAKAKAK